MRKLLQPTLAFWVALASIILGSFGAVGAQGVVPLGPRPAAANLCG
ncbi:MAG: hypothetical protein HC915_18955 [Anaerolineae bacterium]|nr:hypothetical protein [Anaerolineae bacterium]